MSISKIEWTEASWNPITGCTKISSGCKYCYAEVMSRRLCAMRVEKYRNGFQLTMHKDCLDEPLQWKHPKTIFVCSMSDLFHNDVPFEFIDKVFSVIKSTPQHKYQVLTKRADRMEEYFKTRTVPSNVWLGVTVDVQSSKPRIDALRSIKDVPIRFLSCEPLLEDLGALNLDGIDWIIVGGESGIMARPMKEEWVLNIKNQVEAAGKAFYFKQWGTWGSDGIKRSKKRNGKNLQGKVFQAMPI